MRKHRGLFALFPCLVLLGSLSASADVITVSQLDEALTGVVKVNGTSTGEVYIGSFSTTFTNTSLGTTSSTFDSYCIDIFHEFSPPTSWTATQTTSFNTSGNSDSSNPGVANIGSTLAYLYDTYASQATTGTLAAALQIALWTVEYDGVNGNPNTGTVFSIASGQSSALDTAIADAKSYIQALPSNTSGSTADFYLASHPTSNPNYYQDLIGPGSGSHSQPGVATPEPSTMVLAAVGGLFALGTMARKARRDGWAACFETPRG
jgi:PEP-CTERM motif